MGAEFADRLFVVLHLGMVAGRAAFANRYGPAALVFLGLFDVFYALPVYFNVLFGTPGYPDFFGLYTALLPERVTMAFNSLVLTLSVIFAIALVQSRPALPAKSLARAGTRVALLAVACSPIAYVLLSGSAGYFVSYGDLTMNWRDRGGGEVLVMISVLVGASIGACAALLVSSVEARRGGTRLEWLALPALIADIWLMGKRSTVAYLILILGLRVLNRHRHRLTAAHALAGMAGAAVVLAFSLGYLLHLRPESQVDARSSYEYFRIDMGRDHDLKLALHAEMYGPPVLEHRLQSLTFIATMPIPRGSWPEKPYPYPVYATSAALGIPPRDLGWGITTGIFSELVGNLGLAGIPAAALLLIWWVRVLDRSTDAIVLALGTLSVCSLLFLHVGAFVLWPLGLLVYVACRRLWSSAGRGT